ncbi:hypothetical protein BGW42_000884 [Actinomortierella wolfii]|nr:hypothetical protein BGW42_000884 [Actinomortierella wolfii]
MADKLLRIYAQDLTGTLLRQHLDQEDHSLDSVDHISNLIVESLECQDVPISDDTRDPLRLTRAIIKASPEDENGLLRRAQVLKGAVAWLIRAGNEDNVESHGGAGTVDETAQALTNLLIDVSQSFTLEAISQSIHSAVEVVRHQQVPHIQLFSLLARLLVIASNSSGIKMVNSDEDISGAEYLAVMLDRLLLAPWHSKTVLPLVVMLSDLNMNPKQLEAAITKVMKQFEHVDSSDLPVLIYHLLLLSPKGHPRLILKGIIEFFDLLNGNVHCGYRVEGVRPKSALRLGFAELSTMQGTVILHLSFAIKQDQALGNEFLKYMKSGKGAYISPFSIACLLAMARVHRFEDGVMDFLKSSVLSIFKDAEKMEREPWVREFKGMSPIPIAAIMMQVIKMIPFGMEHLTQSLVQFAVYIMDTLASSSWMSSSESAVSKKTAPTAPNELACELGAMILVEVFKDQEVVRTEILDHIMSRVVTKSASASCFLRLLEMIVTDCSSILLDHLQRIKEPLNYLSFLSLPIAIRLLSTVKDLSQLNRPFRDGLIVILRKALFSKSLESRQVALSGLLMLLEPVSIRPKLFRAGSSRTTDSSADQGAISFSMEILTMLRRCLGQQGEIRLSLYEGLLRISQQSPHLNPYIFEMLHAHVYELLVNEQLQAECKRDLDRLLLGLDRAGLEDFELDKTSEFNMNTNLGIRNNMFASLVIGCLESAIEYVVLRRNSSKNISANQGNGKGLASAHAEATGSGNHYDPAIGYRFDTGAADQIIQLFTKMRKLHDIVRERSPLTRVGKRLGLLGEATVLGLESVTYLMESVFASSGDEPGLLDPEAQTLRQQDDFVYYISVAASGLLQKLQTSTIPLLENEHDYCRRLCKVFVREFLVSDRPNAPQSIAAGAKSKDRTKSLLMVGIEGLTAGLAILRIHYPVSVSPASKISTAPLRIPDNRPSSGDKPMSSPSSGVATATVDFSSRTSRPHHRSDSTNTSFAATTVQNDKIVAGFLAALLPQEHQQLSSEERAQVVAWTTSSVMLLDIEGLAACFIDYLESAIILMINGTVPLVREAAGLLGLIHELARYLSRPTTGYTLVNSSLSMFPLKGEVNGPENMQGVVSSGGSTMDRLTLTDSATGVRVEGSELSLLVHWLVTLCRDQPVEDGPLTKAILTLLLSLEQVSPLKDSDQALYRKNEQVHRPPQPQTGATTVTALGGAPVSTSSLLAKCPMAAVRLRLAGDVLLTLDLNNGPGFQAVDDPRRHEEFGDDVEALERVQALYRELGAPQIQDAGSAVLSLVSVRNAAIVAETLLAFVDQALDGLEWVLGKIKYCGLGAELDQIYGCSGMKKPTTSHWVL